MSVTPKTNEKKSLKKRGSNEPRGTPKKNEGPMTQMALGPFLGPGDSYESRSFLKCSRAWVESHGAMRQGQGNQAKGLAFGAGAHQAARDPDAEHCVPRNRTAQEQRVHREWAVPSALGAHPV